MNVYFVASTNPSWMRTGYGASLLKADASQLLVSFAEFIKDGNRISLAVEHLPDYEILLGVTQLAEEMDKRTTP